MYTYLYTLITLPLIALYRLIVRHPVLVVFIYCLPFTATLLNEEGIEEEVEETELVVEIDYEDDLVPYEQGFASFVLTPRVIVPFLKKVEGRFIQSAYIKLYMLNCQWLIDLDFLLDA